MIKIANGYSDFCIPYNDKQDVLVEILNELIDGNYRNNSFAPVTTFVYIFSRIQECCDWTDPRAWVGELEERRRPNPAAC